jgi:hypothetical protein
LGILAISSAPTSKQLQEAEIPHNNNFLFGNHRKSRI